MHVFTRRHIANKGFSLVELLVYMVVLSVIMTAVFKAFQSVIAPTIQQTSISESKLEVNMGIDLLRTDIEHAGYGLPWMFEGGINYSEPALFSDAPSGLPRALASADTSASSLNNSDYLTIKATNVTRNGASQAFGYVTRDTGHNIVVHSLSTDAAISADRVIVIRPEVAPNQLRQLQMNGSAWVAQPTSMTNFAPPKSPNDLLGRSERYIFYGIDETSAMRPFNRTDYFINNVNIPSHCAPNTGVLQKATVNQNNDNFSFMPIVDCVADFQVVYHLDTDGDGGWDTISDANALNGLTAKQIREQVKEVRCYILTHEGGLDGSYTHSTATINVGEMNQDNTSLLAGQTRDLSTLIGGAWQNYRWKVYSLAITPKNLR